MKFSILIPTLNEEKYVGVLLSSLLDQTFSDFEVIVVDAMSEDNTLKEVSRYKVGLKLKLIKSKKRGISFQRNLAAENSASPNLIFLDADVKLRIDFLEKLYQATAENNFDIATSWNIPLKGKLIDKLLFEFYNRVVLGILVKFFPGAIGTFIYVKKEVFDEIGGFNEKMVVSEDLDLIKRVVKKGYIFKVLKNPKVYFSVRRINEQGRLQFALKSLFQSSYYFIFGPESTPSFLKYEHGSHE